jgi:hypothetical protein
LFARGRVSSEMANVSSASRNEQLEHAIGSAKFHADISNMSEGIGVSRWQLPNVGHYFGTMAKDEHTLLHVIVSAWQVSSIPRVAK